MWGLTLTKPVRDKLLVVQPLVGIGDMIWHKPWIDALCQKKNVILATKPSVNATILFHETEGLIEYLPIDRSQRGKKGYHDGLYGFWRLVTDFKSTGATEALIMHHSPRYAIAALFAGIKSRWGYGIGSQRWWLNKGQFLKKDARKIHPIEKIKSYAMINGFRAKPIWQLNTSTDASEAADEFLLLHHVTDPSNILVLGIGAMNEERCWPLKRFAELIKLLSQNYPHLICCMMGSPAEKTKIQEIIGFLPSDVKVLTACEKLDVAIALLARAKGFIGNDSGLLNIAVACGKPSLGIFAASPPLNYSPNLYSVSVEAAMLGKPGQIKTITEKQVYGAALNMFGLQKS